MCSVSVIQDYWRHQGPLPWTKPLWNDYQEALRLLKKLDTKLGQPDCEDATKAAWMQDIEKRLTALE